MVPLRLPGSAAQVFTERLRASFPLAAEKVLTRIREMRDGELNDARFGNRMRGHGQYIQTVHDLFQVTLKRLGFETREITPQASRFRRPERGQLRLFGDKV
jgi:DNA repair photolyase